MNEIQLTKDSSKLIAVIYKLYLDKKSANNDKEDCIFFSGSKHFHENYFPKWSFNDLDYTFRELSRAGLIQCEYGDNMVTQFYIRDEGIIYMENRFSDGMKSVLNFISEHIPDLITLLIP